MQLVSETKRNKSQHIGGLPTTANCNQQFKTHTEIEFDLKEVKKVFFFVCAIFVEILYEYLVRN